ncbi:MAG: MFS transporter [Pseudomonadota bacterium]
MTAIVSFAALFASIMLVQFGSGSLGPLDVLAATARGFTDQEIGLLGSAHFAGFLLGCVLAPRLIGGVGHSRVFAAAAAIGAVGALLHPVFELPYAWALLRMLTGIAIATAYTVIESWLQAKTPNESRGRVYGIFRLTDMTAQIGAQGMVALLDPASFIAYNVVATFCCLCLLPLALTKRVAPETPTAPALRPLAAWRLSPAAMAAVLVAALSGAAFRMTGPVYVLRLDLGAGSVALFLIAGLVGGELAQWPVGWLADRVDRRRVMIGISAATLPGCLFLGHGIETLSASSATIEIALALGAFVFGATAFPLYSLATTYANDYAPPEMIVDLNASIIFFFSLGAIAAPLVSAQLIAARGPGAMFDLIAVAHLSLIVFALYRAARRPGASPSTPYAYVPRTSMVLARLFGTRPPAAGPAPPDMATDPKAGPVARQETPP